jgi:ribosome-binding factor A
VISSKKFCEPWKKNRPVNSAPCCCEPISSGYKRMDDHRARRVSEAVKEELSELIGFEMEDPRLISVSVTSADVSPDMRHAHVKVAAGAGEEKNALIALEHAANFLRHELAARLNMRRVPELHFSTDSHPEADSRVEFLLRRAKRNRGRE